MPITNSIPSVAAARKKNPANSADAATLQNEYRGLAGKSDPSSQARRRELVGLIRTARRSEKAPGTPTTPADQVNTQVMPQPPQFRSVSDFYQGNVAESPIYQQRLKEGQRALNSRLSSMGLTNSGAAINQDVDMVGKLTAEETGRMQNLAQLDATRFDNLRDSEMSRRERMGQNQIDNMLRVADLYLRQNPMNEATQGQDRYNQLLKEMASGNANVIRNNTPLKTGGTGTPPPVFDPGYASKPDYSMNDILGIGLDRTGDKSLSGLFGDIFNLFR